MSGWWQSGRWICFSIFKLVPRAGVCFAGLSWDRREITSSNCRNSGQSHQSNVLWIPPPVKFFCCLSGNSPCLSGWNCGKQNLLHSNITLQTCQKGCTRWWLHPMIVVGVVITGGWWRVQRSLNRGANCILRSELSFPYWLKKGWTFELISEFNACICAGFTLFNSSITAVVSNILKVRIKQLQKKKKIFARHAEVEIKGKRFMIVMCQECRERKSFLKTEDIWIIWIEL